MSSDGLIAFVYCCAAAASAFVLLFNARTVSEITPRYSIERYTCLAIMFAGFAAIFDCAYTLREMHVVTFSNTANYMLTLAYVICLTLCGLYWVCYSEIKQNSWVTKTKKRFTLYALPLYLLLLLILSTPFTHVYFYFEDLHYQRGPLFLLLSSILFLYVVLSGITALVRSFKREHYVNRKEFRRLFAFAAVYIVIQIVQLALPPVFPYRSVGMMLFFEVFLIQNMQELIGRDPLTHSNNRFAAERQLGTLFGSGEAFEIVMLDVDKFKSVNDQHGHQEGDKALQCVALALEKVLDSSCFTARMGGDEFLIINGDVSSSIENIEEKLNESLGTILEQQNRPYRFTVSAGYALKDESIKSIPDLIELADRRLYSRKAQKKTLRE